MFTRIKQAFRSHSSPVFTLAFLIACLGLGELAVQQYKQQAHEKAWQEAVYASEHIQETLTLKFTEALRSETLLVYLIEKNGQVHPEELKAIIKGMFKDSRYLRNIAIAPHNQITYLYPLAGSEKALGLRYHETPAQWPMVKHAMQKHAAYLAGPLKLVQGTSGLLYLNPVFLKDGSYWGIISMSINTDEFLSFIGLTKGNSALQVGLRNKESQEGSNGVFYGDEQLFNAEGVRANISIPGGNWELIVKPTDPASTNATLHSAVAALSLVLSLLLYQALYLKRQTNTHKRLAQTALHEGLVAAEQANTAKTQFLTMMSHEIRTPLNAILGMQELLAYTPLNNTQVEYLQTATLAGKNLLTLINDILDLSKVESGKLDLEVTVFNAAELTRACVHLLTVTAQAKQVKLVTIIDPELKAWISGDALRFRQVLLNLLGNAIKFTENGSVTVKLSPQASSDNDCALLVEVIDTGIGIPVKQQSGLFNLFIQATPSDARKYGGSGLGLAISKRLVALWGGEIGLDSTPGIGSRFWFSVGALADAPDKTPIAAKNPVDSIAPGTFNAQVLLVDDSPTNQMVLAAMLRNASHQVDIAACGTEAIKAASENVYDLILMDVSMPGMCGMEATTIIRQLGGAAATVPIIALTAHAMSGYDAICLAAGMNGYATKPISQKDLLAIVTTWCTRPETEQTTAVSTLAQDSPTLPTDEQAIIIDEAILAELTSLLGQEHTKVFLQQFVNDLKLSCEAIKQAIHSHDLSVFSRAAHDIKSNSALIGATSLQALAQELEAFAIGDDSEMALLGAENLLPCAELTMKVIALRF
jgi:signal transduction histidine kinase/DNA-binding response OmpR family regulator